MVRVSPILGSAGSNVTELISPTSVGLAGVVDDINTVQGGACIHWLTAVGYDRWLSIDRMTQHQQTKRKQRDELHLESVQPEEDSHRKIARGTQPCVWVWPKHFRSTD